MRSFEETAMLDDSLHQLAFYEVTEGKLIAPKNAEDIVNLHQKVANKFNYYKDLIHRGECTIDMIRNDVLGTYGPFPRSKPLNVDDPNFINRLAEQEQQRQLDEQEVALTYNKAISSESVIKDIFKAFLPNGQASVKVVDSPELKHQDISGSKIKIEDISKPSNPSVPKKSRKKSK